MKTAAVVVAAGEGRRMGGVVPKQFQNLIGQPVLVHTLRKLEQCAAIDEIVVVVQRDWRQHATDVTLATGTFRKITQIIAGGTQRQDSVYAGLKTLDDSIDVVVVHDAVRPFTKDVKIMRVIQVASESGAAILAIQPRDTVKRAAHGFVEETLERDSLWLVQTPQAFKCSLLITAYESAFADGVYKTDEAALVERIGHPVRIVTGDEGNFKITLPGDLAIAEKMLESAQCV